MFVLIVLVVATRASAQTPTVTPTSTPTVTALATTGRPAAELSNYVLLNTVSVVTADSLRLYAAPYRAITAHVTASGTCSAYDLVIEGTNSPMPVAWAPLTTPASIDETVVLPNTAKLYVLTTPVGWIRARTHTAVTSCRVIVTLDGVL